MPVELTRELVLLCEGAADQAFFRKLIAGRGLPAFDMLPPNEGFYGATNFDRMLKAIAGDRRGLSNLKGILIVADSKDSPVETFKDIQRQISSAGGYRVPNQLSVPSAKSGDHPAVAVTPIPGDQESGGLETLCVQELAGRHPWILPCLDTYLACDGIEVATWPAEKRDKAKYHCMVAVLNRDDPSRAVSYAFKNPAPLLDVSAECYRPVAEKLARFCANLGVG